MKKVLFILITTLLFCGCATGPVIGPFSYLTTQSNKKAYIRRSAAMSSKLTTEEKVQVFRATKLTSRPGEIAAGIGVDIFELVRGNYTGVELLKNVGGVAGDVTLYGLIGYGLKEYVDSSSNVTINGDNNTVNTSK